MRKVICDVCEKASDVSYSTSVPTGWSEIRITGSVKKPNRSYPVKCSTARILCDTCVVEAFDFEEVKKPIEKQWEELTMDWLSDMAADAVQDAVENM